MADILNLSSVTDPKLVYLDNAKAAEFLGIEPSTLDTWRSNRRKGRFIPFVKVGAIVRYRLSDLIEWLESNRVEA